MHSTHAAKEGMYTSLLELLMRERGAAGGSVNQETDRYVILVNVKLMAHFSFYYSVSNNIVDCMYSLKNVHLVRILEDIL